MTRANADITVIGFDADDTLWQNEKFFKLTEDRLVSLLADYADTVQVPERLLAAERRNLGHYGFGIKAFTLSMIETAIEVSDGAVPAAVIAEILATGREMLKHPVETLPDVRDVLADLSQTHRLVLITKGDLLDQERKLAESGLGDFFSGVEIVSDKTAATYARVFARHGDGPSRAMMVGNSLRSDVLPAIEAGSWGVHVPHALTWAYEEAEAPAAGDRFRTLERLAGLRALIAELA